MLRIQNSNSKMFQDLNLKKLKKKNIYIRKFKKFHKNFIFKQFLMGLIKKSCNFKAQVAKYFKI